MNFCVKFYSKIVACFFSSSSSSFEVLKMGYCHALIKVSEISIALGGGKKSYENQNNDFMCTNPPLKLPLLVTFISLQQADISGANPLKFPIPPLPEEAKARTRKDQQVKKKREKKRKKRSPAQPKYSVVHRGEFSMQDFTNDRRSTLVKRPKELVVSVEVPGVVSASLLDLEIFERRVTLQCNFPLYELDVSSIIDI